MVDNQSNTYSSQNGSDCRDEKARLGPTRVWLFSVHKLAKGNESPNYVTDANKHSECVVHNLNNDA
jgi:hypothetical protein